MVCSRVFPGEHQKNGECTLGRQRPAKGRCDKAGRGSEESRGYDGGMEIENQGRQNPSMTLSRLNDDGAYMAEGSWIK